MLFLIVQLWLEDFGARFLSCSRHFNESKNVRKIMWYFLELVAWLTGVIGFNSQPWWFPQLHQFISSSIHFPLLIHARVTVAADSEKQPRSPFIPPGWSKEAYRERSDEPGMTADKHPINACARPLQTPSALSAHRFVPEVQRREMFSHFARV